MADSYRTYPAPAGVVASGMQVFNAPLGASVGRSAAVNADPGWRPARELPGRTPAVRPVRGAAFRAAEASRGFTVDAAQSFASSLRRIETEVAETHRRADLNFEVLSAEDITYATPTGHNGRVVLQLKEV